MADANVLLVEGKDDEHVFYALAQYYKFPSPSSLKLKTKRGLMNF
jgi:hypothetical protein